MRKPSLCLFLAPLLVSACVAVPTQNPGFSSPKPPSASPAPLSSPMASINPEPTEIPIPIAFPTEEPPIFAPEPSATQTPDTFFCDIKNFTPKPYPYLEKSYLFGQVFDDKNMPLDGVTIRAKSLNSSVPFDAISTTHCGIYSFNNAPSGITIEIMATRLGYSTRRQIVILNFKGNLEPNLNRFDFGNDGVQTAFGMADTAISEKPEVIGVSPAHQEKGVFPGTPFRLKFSKPMDTATVVDNFLVSTFTDSKLSVDLSPAEKTLQGSTPAEAMNGTRIYDKEAFNVAWNQDDTEATFQLKNGLSLPSDRFNTKTPVYQVALNRKDGIVKDKSGNSRGSDSGVFRLTLAGFEQGFTFSIQTDGKSPALVSLSADPKAQDFGGLSLSFDEAMQLPTLGGTIAGGMGGDLLAAPAALPPFVSASQAADNYFLTIKRAGQILQDHVSWASLGGEATIDLSDLHRILLTKARIQFQAGDELEMKVAATLKDPAGNKIYADRCLAKLVYALP